MASAIRRISRRRGGDALRRPEGRAPRPAAAWAARPGAGERGPSLGSLLCLRLVEEVELDDVVVALGHERG
jgi:hypothetical protein